MSFCDSSEELEKCEEKWQGYNDDQAAAKWLESSLMGGWPEMLATA